jgi:hypothetical protein
MTLRVDAATVLVAMGARLDVDFVAHQDATGVQLTALNGYVLPSEATINAFDLPTAQLQALYAKAKALLTADDPISKKEKAFVLVCLDEFNAHATKINAILTAIDGAGTFAAMKTAIGAINDYPQRTAAQIKTSISNKIDAGEANG